MIPETPEKSVDDRLELIKSIAEVHSKIEDVVSADFLMSKLNEKEKEYIVEMTSNAFLSRKILLMLLSKATNTIWDDRKNKWETMPLTEIERKQLQLDREQTFDAYMNKIYMLNIVNRNVPKNYIIEKITGIMDAQEEQEGASERRIDKLARQFKEATGMQKKEEEVL